MRKIRAVNEKLSLAYEACFQRDNISPHVWSRESETDEFSQLLCETELTDEQWNFYTKLAEGEYLRANSLTPGQPVFMQSIFGESGEYHLDVQGKIMGRLGSDVSYIHDDVSDPFIHIETD